jgi:NAD(P)-dependent dehydrogenase (short-subunit alcohol dehydrogenase family)
MRCLPSLLKGWQIMDDRKTILITGSSSGIGYDAAHGLAKLGWRVFATCRKPEDCARLESEGLESFLLDYDDQASMEIAVAETLSRTGGTLDALFNNGAFGFPAYLEDVPTPALRAIFETNFFAQHELARLLMPTFRTQGHGRILMNSSILGFVTLTRRGPYNATKFAMEGWADTLRLELDGSGIHVVLIEPGPITSDIRLKSQPHFEKWIDPTTSVHTKAYEDVIIPRLYADVGKPDTFELPASAVTDVVVKALEAKRPKARYRITTPTKVFWYLKRVLSTRMLDRLLIRA